MYSDPKNWLFLCEMSRDIGQEFAYSGIGMRKRHFQMEWDKMGIFVYFLPLCPLSFFSHLHVLRKKDNSHWKTLLRNAIKGAEITPLWALYGSPR